MKKVLFIIIYVCVCLVPLGTLWLEKNKDTASSEKRELQAFPQPLTEEGKLNTSYFSEFDGWFSDHMGCRSLLIEAQSKMKEVVFLESAENSVILGQDGWLFYAETADDFCNVHLLSERNADNVARTLSIVQEYCEENGAEFVFTVAPNKNTLYPKNMPARYVKVQGSSNLDMLVESLHRRGVHYVDLKTAFLNESKILYQPRDSHWTYEGGLLAYRTIVKELSTKHTLFDGLTFTERADWDADLVNMIFPNAADDDLQSYPDISYTFSTKAGQVHDEAMQIETYGGAGQGNLLMFRDSFGNTTWRYFAEAFQKAEFQRSVPYQITDVERVKADTVILEIVERNLINLALKAPVVPAPTVEPDFLDAYAMERGSSVMQTEDYYGYCHVFGTIDERYLGETYRAFLVVDYGSEKEYYEAFPIFEQELLGKQSIQDNGYSAYLPEEAANAVSICVLVKTEGMYYYDAKPQRR